MLKVVKERKAILVGTFQGRKSIKRMASGSEHDKVKMLKMELLSAEIYCCKLRALKLERELNIVPSEMTRQLTPIPGDSPSEITTQDDDEIITIKSH